MRSVLAIFLALSLAAPAAAQQIDLGYSFYVPQTGPVLMPTEGTTASQFFRACPNNDGGTSLPNNARIKIVLRGISDTPIVGIPPGDIWIPINGGTSAQGFTGTGADSIIANGTWNAGPLCPDLRYLYADAPTDAEGVTYITFGGADPASPGVYVRDPDRKWGHYDTDLLVIVRGAALIGRLTTASPPGTYVLRIKNMDMTGGLGRVMNAGEVVSSLDFNSVTNGRFHAAEPESYWRDLNDDGFVTFIDANIVTAHLNHDCDTPYAP